LVLSAERYNYLFLVKTYDKVNIKTENSKPAAQLRLKG
jgi:hypothetical protein